MKELGFFLLGILFYEIIFPILSGISEAILGKLQLILGEQAVKMTEYNATVEKIKEEFNQEPEQSSAIGFQIPNYDEDEDGDEDEE